MWEIITPFIFVITVLTGLIVGIITVVFNNDKMRKTVIEESMTIALTLALKTPIIMRLVNHFLVGEKESFVDNEIMNIKYTFRGDSYTLHVPYYKNVSLELRDYSIISNTCIRKINHCPGVKICLVEEDNLLQYVKECNDDSNFGI